MNGLGVSLLNGLFEVVYDDDVDNGFSLVLLRRSWGKHWSLRWVVPACLIWFWRFSDPNGKGRGGVRPNPVLVPDALAPQFSSTNLDLTASFSSQFNLPQHTLRSITLPLHLSRYILLVFPYSTVFQEDVAVYRVSSALLSQLASLLTCFDSSKISLISKSDIRYAIALDSSMVFILQTLDMSVRLSR